MISPIGTTLRGSRLGPWAGISLEMLRTVATRPSTPAMAGSFSSSIPTYQGLSMIPVEGSSAGYPASKVFSFVKERRYQEPTPRNDAG